MKGLWSLKQPLTGLGWVVVLILIFTGCTDNPKPAAPPAGGGTLNIRLETAVNSLNSLASSTTGWGRYVAGQIFLTLGTLDPQTLEMKPLLVKAIPRQRIMADGPLQGALAYDFEIIDAARWDNGTPVTAHDVLFTLKLVLHPGLPTGLFRGYVDLLQRLEIDAANPRKFTVYFKSYYILAVETFCQLPIYPAYNYDPNHRLDKYPLTDFIDKTKIQALAKSDSNLIAYVTEFNQPRFSNESASITGCGPYRLEGVIGESGLTLVKKTGWWGDGENAANPLLAAYPERLVYKVVADESAAENMLRTGDLDVMVGSMLPSRFEDLKNDTAMARQYDFSLQPSATSYTRWGLHTGNPKLADVRVRRALARLVDYEYLVKTVYRNTAQRLVGPIHPIKPYYAADIPLYDFNVAKAQSELAEAGWTDTDGDGIVDKMIDGRRVPLMLEVLVLNTKLYEMLAASLVQTARQAGVKLIPIIQATPVVQEAIKSGNFETFIASAALYPGLSELHQNFHSASIPPAGGNYSRFVSARADSLIMAIRTEGDEKKRNILYHQAQELLHNESPDVYLVAPQRHCIVSKKFDHVLTPNRPGFYEHLFALKQNTSGR